MRITNYCRIITFSLLLLSCERKDDKEQKKTTLEIIEKKLEPNWKINTRIDMSIEKVKNDTDSTLNALEQKIQKLKMNNQ